MSKRAAIYCRISRDPEGKKLGVQRQEEDCRALAKRLGLDVVQVYIENDVGASERSAKKRIEYPAMLKAARDGEFDVIVAYSNSRLTRRLRELEDLLDLHQRCGTEIHTVVSGNDDLSTADGRMTARIKASVDAGESERTAERLARAHLQKARRGDVNHGQRPFGWADDKATLHPSEAKRLRDAVDTMLTGGTLRGIARQWRDAGVTTVRGNEWDHRSLRRVLTNPRLAGWRTHRGKVVEVDGKPVIGQWEPLLDQETYERLQGVLSGRKPGTRPERRRYMLSGLLRCGVCGRRMHGGTVPNGYAYRCEGDSSHNCSVTGAGADETVAAVIVARLTEAGPLTAQKDAKPFLGRSRLEQIPDLIADLMAAYSAGTLSAAVVFPQVEKLEDERATLEVARAAHFAGIPAAPVDVDPAAFDQLDPDRQRAVLEALLEAVVVAPSAKGVPFTPERLTFVWRSAS